MFRWHIFGAVLLLIALAGGPRGGALADEPAPAAIDAALAQRIEELTRQLDADEFRTRESATAALIKIGEPARARLTELADSPPSLEVKVRAGKILGSLNLAEIKRNAVKLDDFCEHARLANAGKLDGEKFELLLQRLLAVLRNATGNGNLKSPVRLADVKPAAADTLRRNSLIVIRRGRITSLRDSIVLADVAVDVTSAQNSIIIARAGVSLSSVQNCIVIAGHEVSASHCREGTVLLSGGTVQASIPESTIIGAGQSAHVSISRGNLVLVNTAADERAVGGGREPPREVRTEGLILPSVAPPAENPLAEKITVTAALGEIVLFRRKAMGGELVARLDQPIEHPDGGILPETEGWQACYSSQHSRRHVFFTNGERFVLLPIAR